ncbi:MAG: hypothetical protein JWO76_848 [Nocardioides sp.]|nr:hypothetical protein [Nocardioides sp.]
MRRSRVAFALGVVVPLLVLGGCSDDDPEPRIAPTTSTSPSDTGSPSPTPTSAKEAQAVLIDRYFAEISAAISTGDPDTFLGLTSKRCVNCRIIADNLIGAYAHGGYIEGGSWNVTASEFVRKAPLGFVWNVDVRSAREKWFDRDGSPVKIVDPSTQHFGLALQPQADEWRIREMKLR